MPSAEIISIGTEILLGEIVDTNARYLAQRLKEIGVDLFRKTTVGDNASRIAQAIQEALGRSEIIITTGGLGPTVDDPTREAVAQAVGVSLEYHPELWEQIEDRFRRFNRIPTENNRRQAYIPAGARVIENPVGTAPSFIVTTGKRVIIALPGVPREMEYLLQNAVIPFLRQHYALSTIIKTRTLHTAGVGESQIDDVIGDLEQLSNPTVGLAAHTGQVDVRITAKADSEAQADFLIAGIETDLRQRLGAWVYGADQDTLEAVALKTLQEHGWSLGVVEAGLGGELIRRLAAGKSPVFKGGESLPDRPAPDRLAELVIEFCQAHLAEVGLGVAVYPEAKKQDVCILVITPNEQKSLTRPYGGPPEYAVRWAVHMSLDFLRGV